LQLLKNITNGNFGKNIKENICVLINNHAKFDKISLIFHKLPFIFFKKYEQKEMYVFSYVKATDLFVLKM